MKLQELIDEINTEFGYLDITINFIKELNSIIADIEPDVFQKAAMNQFVSEFYNGIENILKRICKYNNFTLPYGEDSHFKLFNLFVTGGNDALPVVFNPEITNEFKQIRKFRHFIIHGYSFKIERSYIKDSVAKIDSIYQIVKHNILNYLKSST
jgi:hypothetical protein